MTVTLTENWRPDPTAPTKVYSPSAGVTPRGSVQITNNTNGELWVNDSSWVPESVEQAKFVAPPRATTEWPLESADLAARWNSLIANASDLITFVFTDNIVQPRVVPGVQALGGLSSPVQAEARSLANMGVWPYTLSTSSGLNIGQLYVRNNSPLPFQLNNVAVGTRVWIRAYSWLTIPLNRTSGVVTLTTPNNAAADIRNNFTPSDDVYWAWSDINYTVPFPSGAGKLPDPSESMYAALGENGNVLYPAQQLHHSGAIGVPGTTVLYSLPFWDGIGPIPTLLIKTVELHASPINDLVAALEVSAGYDGVTPTAELLFTNPVINVSNAITDTVEECNILIRNFSLVALNQVRIRYAAGAGRVWGGFRGYRFN